MIEAKIAEGTIDVKDNEFYLHPDIHSDLEIKLYQCPYCRHDLCVY